MKKIICSLLLLCSAAAAEPTTSDVLRWDDFPGPASKPAVTEGEAFVVCPTQSGTWDGDLSFALAPVVSAETDALIVQGPYHRFAVPGAFVVAPTAPPKLAVGSYVLFQTDPKLTMSVTVGRVKTVKKGGYTIVYDWGGHTIVDDVPAPRVRRLGGKLAWGVPLSFKLDGKLVLGKYIAPGRDARRAWILSVGKPFEVEVEGMKPLGIGAFKKGQKVQAVFGTTSIVPLDGGKQPPARQFLETGTIVDVLAGGTRYMVKNPDGEIKELSANQVFAL
ncbi:MAG TPA: hypothetical protein VK427_04515 [Kofleriaceae bacterium]|nr:hypothetical protein [Kofleriaceae bacterium]